jgi:hypothetical protein
MADLSDLQASGVTRVVGKDEVNAVDVIAEKGFNKMWVKSTSVPESLGNMFFLKASSGAVTNMNVNGSVTNVNFRVSADATNDLVVDELRFGGWDVGIDLDGFMASAAALTNGILITIKSEDVTFTFIPIKRTVHFNDNFAFGPGGNFFIFFDSPDYLTAAFGPRSPFIIKKAGTYGTNDYIEVRIRDNLTSVDSLELTAFGSKA